ncbi:unnamed protein product [Moneuplotes crassus]|uniref:Uncharacterized protein n=1 Tax=Euplotes crassus TaxID=5936 RepID=A0AAD1X9I6_EUPCR|nr:unnamed protein product [Moneuplotes crassus]
MRLVFILILLSIPWLKATALEEEDELLMLIEITRHGVRSSYGSGSELLNLTWPNRGGDLLEVGERQHYLQGVKLRKRYVDKLNFLEDTFNPQHHFVISTNLNRTIMSAYSQLLGLYPLGKGPLFEDSGKRKAAVPPFKISTEASKFIRSNDVLEHRYSPFPIHVLPNENHLLSGNSYLICPILEDYIGESFRHTHYSTKAELYPLYHDMEQIWGVSEEHLNIEKAWPYLDTYDMATKNGMTVENDLSGNAKNLLNKFWWNHFYEGLFGDPKSAQLTSSELINFIVDNLVEKVKVDKGVSNSEFHKNIRHVLFSAHDTTVSALMKTIEQENTQYTSPQPASTTLIELIKRGNTYYIRWVIDDKELQVGNRCDINKFCEFYGTMDYLNSRTTQNIEEECQKHEKGESSSFPLWGIIAIVVGGLILIGCFSCLCSLYVSMKSSKKEDDVYEECSSDEERESFESFGKMRMNS